jgi:hypothetical protein
MERIITMKKILMGKKEPAINDHMYTGRLKMAA